MKKLLIAVLLIVVVFSLVIYQNSSGTYSNQNDISTISNSAQSSGSMDKVLLTDTEENELLSPISTDLNSSEDESGVVVSIVEKGNPNTFHHDLDDTMSFTSHTALYNDSGELVVTGIIKNETSHHISNIRVRVVEIYNEDDELIASECFGYIQANLILKPDESIDWTFTFPAITVSIKNDDLDYISTIIESSNRGFQ